MLTIFGWNFEIWAVQKYVNLVDLVKSFPTNIYLQKSASIQPRTSLSKFGGKFNSIFIRLLTSHTSASRFHAGQEHGRPTVWTGRGWRGLTSWRKTGQQEEKSGLPELTAHRHMQMYFIKRRRIFTFCSYDEILSFTQRARRDPFVCTNRRVNQHLW